MTKKIKTVKKLENPIPEKAILWPTEPYFGNLANGDSDSFPDLLSITTRYSSNQPTPLATFGRAVADALDRVWIIDPYLLDPDKDKGTPKNRIASVLSWIPKGILAKDIKILTKSHNTHENKSADKILQAQFQEYANSVNNENVLKETIFLV